MKSFVNTFVTAGNDFEDSVLSGASRLLGVAFDASNEYERMPQDQQIAWQQRVIARYPKLAKIVRDSA
jgi:hypothetical protein